MVPVSNNANDQGSLVLATGAALVGTPNVFLNHGNSNAYTDLLTFDAPSAGTAGYTQNFGTLAVTQKTGFTVSQTSNITGTSVAAFGATNIQAQNNQAFTFTGNNGASITMTSLTAGAGAAATTAIVNLQGTSTGNAITGAITNGLATGGIIVNKSAAGTWTLSGSDTYTGATAVTAGTLALGNGGQLSKTAVTISNAGTTFAVTWRGWCH